jgi:ABC-type sugar transport system substrate-binding protein
MLAACAPAAPQTIIQTVEVPGAEVVKTVEVVVTQEVVTTVEVEREGPITIGYGAPGLDAFQAGVMYSVINYAEGKGWKVIPADAARDAEKQANQIDDFISLGVDAIVAVPEDSQAFCASVAKAVEAGIPIYTIDRAPAGCEVNMVVQADNSLGGVQSAEAIVKFLEEKYGEAKGTVLELQGDMGQNVAQLRSAGFNETMAQYPGITVVSKPTEWKGEKFFQSTLDVVGSQEVDAIYAHSDSVGTIPILQALEQLGKKIKAGEEGHIYLATIDGTPNCLSNIREGYQDQCSSQPNPDFGILVNYIEKEFNGEAIEPGDVIQEGAPWSPAKIETSDVGLMLNLATTSVTSENVDDPALWGNK